MIVNAKKTYTRIMIGDIIRKAQESTPVQKKSAGKYASPEAEPGRCHCTCFF